MSQADTASGQGRHGREDEPAAGATPGPEDGTAGTEGGAVTAGVAPAAAASAPAAVWQDSGGQERRTVRFGRTGGPMVAHQAVITYAEDGTPQISLEALGDLPAYVQADLEAHREGPFQLQLTEPSETSIKLAFLAWAFLAIFAAFGYRYALSPASRVVRRALVDQTQAFGSAFWLSFGPLTADLRSYALAYVLRDTPADVLLGIGVRFGDSVLVCLPPASDAVGSRLRDLGNEIGPDGHVEVRLRAFGDGDLEDARRTAAGELAGLRLIGTSQGADLVVAATVDEALATLAQPARPAMNRRSNRRRMPIRDAWFDDAYDIPGYVAPDNWVIQIVDELERRPAGCEPATIADLRRLARELAPAAFVEAASARLEPHLGSHVRDSFRIFVLGESADEVDELGDADALGRARAVLTAAGRAAASISLTSAVLNTDTGLSSHALIAVDGAQELIVGKYYTAHTTMLAAEVALAEWQTVTSES